MDPATLALVETGFSIVGNFLGRFARGESSAKDSAIRTQELCQFVEASVSEFGRSLSVGVAAVIEKLEADELELLLSRAQNLSVLLDAGKPELALPYAMTLRESVDYARNRLKENKVHWLGPYLAGSGIYFAAVDAAGVKREMDLRKFRNHLEEIKIEILNNVVPQMISSGVDVPWVVISHFMLDTTECPPELLAHLRNIGIRRAPSVTIHPTLEPPPASRSRTLPVPTLDVRALAINFLHRINGAYVSPKIPKAKLDGAREKVLPLADTSDSIVALIDLTLWGDAKRCVAVFNSYIIIGSGDPPKRYAYMSLPETASDGPYLYLGQDRFCMMTDYQAEALKRFLRAIRVNA